MIIQIHLVIIQIHLINIWKALYQLGITFWLWKVFWEIYNTITPTTTKPSPPKTNQNRPKSVNLRQNTFFLQTLFKTYSELHKIERNCFKLSKKLILIKIVKGHRLVVTQYPCVLTSYSHNRHLFHIKPNKSKELVLQQNLCSRSQIWNLFQSCFSSIQLFQFILKNIQIPIITVQCI